MSDMEPEKKENPDIKVEIIDGGPLKITGPIILKDLKRDVTVNLQEVCLCLCGRTTNTPYCDETHCNNPPETKE